MPRVLDDKPDVVVLGECDTRHNVFSSRGIYRVSDIVSELTRLLNRRVGVARLILERRVHDLGRVWLTT